MENASFWTIFQQGIILESMNFSRGDVDLGQQCATIFLWKVVAPRWKTQHSVSGMKDGRGRITTMDNIFIIIVECWAIFSHHEKAAAPKNEYLISRQF